VETFHYTKFEQKWNIDIVYLFNFSILGKKIIIKAYCFIIAMRVTDFFHYQLWKHCVVDCKDNSIKKYKGFTGQLVFHVASVLFFSKKVNIY